MKKNLWLFCGLMLSGGLLAQQTASPKTATPIETPAAAPMAAVPLSPGLTAEAPTPAGTNHPAAKTAKKKSGKKKSPKGDVKKAVVKKPVAKPAPAELKTIPLVPGPATVIASHVNVRGQGRLKGEVIGHLAPGDSVNVIEEVALKSSGPDEPSVWAKISLPPTIHTWINATFVDANKTVTSKRLNLRGGPGENYSVLGRIERGETVKAVSTKGDWMEIETPTNAFGFVAAVFLKQEEPAPAAAAPEVAATTPPPATPPPAVPAVITPPPPVAPLVEIPAPPVAVPAAPAPTPIAATPAPTPPPAVVEPTPAVATPPVVAPPVVTPPVATPPVVETPPPVVTPPAVPTPTPTETAPAPAKPAEPVPAAPVDTAATPAPAPEAAAPETKPEEPLPPRIVQREGTVRGMTSIQAPSYFALISVDTGKNIDYLYTTSTNLHLDRYKGAHVVVVGEEFLDARWGNTPVIDIQKLIVLKDAGF